MFTVPHATPPVRPGRDDQQTDDEGLAVSRSQVGGVHVVTVTGEVDMLTEPTMSQAVESVIAGSDGRAVVIDLSGVSFFSSTGMSALLRAQDLASRRGISLGIVAEGTGQVLRTLQLTGLDRVVGVHQSLAEATAAPAADGADGSLPG